MEKRYNQLRLEDRDRILSRDEGNGKTGLYVADTNGDIVGPDRAKVIISKKSGRTRLLFKDPEYGEWIEPESFYSFSSRVFYEEDENVHRDTEGFTIEAIKAPVWHGVSGIGIKFKTDNETVIFSSDTVHSIELWKRLYSEKREQRMVFSRKEFESATVIYGDINDYIERGWSEDRFRDAINAFNNAVVIHDVSGIKSVVHTDYVSLAKNVALKKDKVILTHSPDTITSEWVLSRSDKHFKIKGNTFFEIVGDKLYTFNADVYHKEAGKYYVGYKNPEGEYAVYENDGLLVLLKEEPLHGIPVYRVDLYEDIGGKYFPKLESTGAAYQERKDGRVELVKFTVGGSRGVVVKDHRERLVKKLKISGDN